MKKREEKTHTDNGLKYGGVSGASLMLLTILYSALRTSKPGEINLDDFSMNKVLALAIFVIGSGIFFAGCGGLVGAILDRRDENSKMALKNSKPKITAGGPTASQEKNNVEEISKDPQAVLNQYKNGSNDSFGKKTDQDLNSISKVKCS